MTETHSEPRRLSLPFDSQSVESMQTLLKLSKLPEKPPIPTADKWSLGIDLEYLANLREAFVNTWSWKDLERRMRLDDNYVVEMKDDSDELTVHFIHCKSARVDAIPLIILHGWPGTAFDYSKVIDGLINPPAGEPAFHVVAPSLPGFFLSTLPNREGWTIVDTAKIFNCLMTDVLGYQVYAAQAGDWGSHLLRVMSSTYPSNILLTLFNMFHCPTVAPQHDKKNFESLSLSEARAQERREEFYRTGQGYFHIQRTKPLTIGNAVGASPLSILAYIGEKIYSWSDPSLVNANDILDAVALYYLSGSFASSVLIYEQSDKVLFEELMSTPVKQKVKSKVGYSAYPFEIGRVYKEDIEAACDGPVVYYKEHDAGGHFPALDCPEEFVGDLREFCGKHWNTTP
ncbi:alpha/beta-hydrolase [Schizopora paradoxa]|uniref:Alpha/beta-hydrolase n=1 Tax=Schizopora paradoxa TaxID=27342 RepID=A0A0H2RTM7_9AGAM|nr:alpha/beta-hydrolase [Schizopora paradoxa]